MNRLAKKCLIGSATLHGSLLGVVLICSAFVAKETPKNNVIELFPHGNIFTVTAGASHGGGAPPPQPVKAADPTPPAPAPAPTPTPQKVEKTEVPTKVQQPVVKAPAVKPPPTKDDDSDDGPPVRRHTPKVDLRPVTRTSNTKTQKTKSTSQEQSDSDNAAENASKLRKAAQNIFGIASSITSKTAQSMVTDSYGDGSGGIASVNYNTVLFTRYYNAWVSPDEVDDRNAVTDARITIARDGTVISATIEKRSGNGAMDRSIERAIRSVRSLPAFPAEWKESQRTFQIRFNLKSKDLGIG